MSIFRRRRAMRIADLLRDYPGDRFDVLGSDDLMAVANAVQRPLTVEERSREQSLLMFNINDLGDLYDWGIAPW